MKLLLTLSEADEDVLEIVAYYDGVSAALGTAFIEEIQTAFTLIAERPDTWPRFSSNLRKFLMHRFPYRILYENREDVVLVIGVMHTKRRPGTWIRRTPKLPEVPPEIPLKNPPVNPA